MGRCIKVESSSMRRVIKVSLVCPFSGLMIDGKPKAWCCA